MRVDGDLKVRRREAAEWFTRLGRRSVSVEDIKAFAEWRNDPRNDRAYQEVESLWEASKGLTADPEIQALTAAAGSRTERPGAERSPPWRSMGLMAAATLLILSSGIWLLQRPSTYATSVGEQRTVRLEDGSELTLDTDTRVRVRSTARARSVTLVAGQAHFNVAKDPDRPFVVKAGETEVTALGTRFDVRRLGEGARITLVEGRVAVRAAPAVPPVELRPGQQVATVARKPVVRQVDAQREIGWTVGRLTFESIPIRAAVEEVNRYTEAKVRLEAPGIQETAISGVFNAGDVEAFVSALAERYHLSIERLPDGSVVLREQRRPQATET